MLYGTPSRAAHRATDDGLGQLIRTGQHRQPPRTRMVLSRPGIGQIRARTPQSRPRTLHSRPRTVEPERAADWLVRGLAAMIVLGVAVMVGVLAMADERRGTAVATSAGIEPLSLAEVFPDPLPGTGYRVVAKHADPDCSSATAGRLGAMLAEHGCSQVLRAAMDAPRGDYQVTAGIFTLRDPAAADAVGTALRKLVETGDGGFSSMVGGQVGQTAWDIDGQYLLYCVITRTGGALVTPADPEAARITEELVDGYLSESVVGPRVSGA
jgi:hypothetical protein